MKDGSKRWLLPTGMLLFILLCVYILNVQHQLGFGLDFQAANTQEEKRGGSITKVLSREEAREKLASIREQLNPDTAPSSTTTAINTDTRNNAPVTTKQPGQAVQRDSNNRSSIVIPTQQDPVSLPDDGKTESLIDFNNSFPECFVHKSLEIKTNKGKYVRVDPAVDSPPKYDHMCFIMKSRYNCEYQASSRKTKASDFKLVLKQSGLANQTMCDLRRLVEVAGGPQGVAQQVFLRQASNDNGNTNGGKLATEKFQILLHGSSFLRQVFEGLVCGFQSQITDLKVQIGGPSISRSALKERKNGTLIRRDEMSKKYIGFDEARNGGCHAPGPGEDFMKKYYRPNVTVPPNIPGCNDNFAMVEFGNVFRVYYVFRSPVYERDAVEHALEKIGYLDPTTKQAKPLDLIVWNEKVDRKLFSSPTEYPYSEVLGVLKNIQTQWIGEYYGANNPFITHPPDDHPCMPGIPDDEVNFLLLKILNDFVVKKSN
jgi:hypothetical protein